MRRAVLLAVSVLFLAGCGGGETVSPTGPVEGPLPKAEPASTTAGKKVYADSGCGGCHVFAPAKSTGSIGPNLQTSLAGKDEDFVRDSIVEPSAQIADGYPDAMPKDYGTRLDSKQLADLVAFLLKG